MPSTNGQGPSLDFIGYAAMKSSGELLPGIISRVVTDISDAIQQLDTYFPKDGPHVAVEVHRVNYQRMRVPHG